MSGYGMVERTAGAVTIPIRSAKFAEFDGRGDQMACSRTCVDVGGTEVEVRTGTSCRAHGSRVHLFGDAVSRSRANERDIAPLSSTCNRSALKLSSRDLPRHSLPDRSQRTIRSKSLTENDEESEAVAEHSSGRRGQCIKEDAGKTRARGRARSQLDSESVGEGSESNSRTFDPFHDGDPREPSQGPRRTTRLRNQDTSSSYPRSPRATATSISTTASSSSSNEYPLR